MNRPRPPRASQSQEPASKRGSPPDSGESTRQDAFVTGSAMATWSISWKAPFPNWLRGANVR